MHDTMRDNPYMAEAMFPYEFLEVTGRISAVAGIKTFACQFSRLRPVTGKGCQPN